MELQGRTALITGSCGEGMGRSTAFRLAREGANIVLNYGTHRRGATVKAHSERIADGIDSLGGRAIVCEADTAIEDEVEGMVKAAREAFGSIDILVNNAGGEWSIKDYTKIPHEHWKDVLADEIDAPFLLMKHIVPGMRKRKWGRIIHIGMQGALMLQQIKGLAPDYCLGKAARAWMTTAFGIQEFGNGITVNAVEPGLTAHMRFEDAFEAVAGSGRVWRAREKVMVHDIAEIVAFLCSEAARFISGSSIRLPTDP